MNIYSAKSIATYFLNKAWAEGIEMTPLKVIKMVYIAHGWNLAFFRNPLIDESVVAWQYGPVIRTLYHQFKQFKGGPITKDCASLGMPAHIDDKTKNLLDQVWEAYKSFTGTQLSTLTHQVGTPWYTAWHDEGGNLSYNYPINDELIRRHFVDLSNKRR